MPVLIGPLMGVWFIACSERAWEAGGISLPRICLGERSGWLWGRRADSSYKPPFFLPVPLVALPLPLKTILRIITFIMSFIMGYFSSCLKINAGLENYIWCMEVVYM